MRFEIKKTNIEQLCLITRAPISDARGSLTRIFCAEELALAGWHRPIAQINHTITKMTGTVRGLHFQQSGYSEMKLVTCLRGSVWDVAVDLRSDSPTFLKWFAVELSASNQQSMLIPEGFAHGFQTLVDDCELIYLHSTAYAPHAEFGLNPIDPMLSINWPLAITNLSNRDAKHPLLDSQFKGVVL